MPCSEHASVLVSSLGCLVLILFCCKRSEKHQAWEACAVWGGLTF